MLLLPRAVSTPVGVPTLPTSSPRAVGKLAFGACTALTPTAASSRTPTLLTNRPRAVGKPGPEEDIGSPRKRARVPKKLSFFDFVNTPIFDLERILLRTTVVELKDLQHVRVIGKGSFGTVRLVQHRRFPEQQYALKRVRRGDPQVLEWVERECTLLSEVDHPFIMALAKTFKTEASVYILAELFTGGELFDALNTIGRPLERREAQFYAGSLLLALEHLHASTIVYRDLKPENVMLDRRGYLKLIDFGIAKKLTDGRTFTLIGSFAFMAPEVSLRVGYGVEVDIWSLGVMLFDFVCGHLPFGSDILDHSGKDICNAVRNDNLVFPKCFKDQAGKALLRGMLRKTPDQRLGFGIDGFEHLKGHEYFKAEYESGVGTLFDRLLSRQLEPPFKPLGESYMDLSEEEASLSDGDELA